MTRPSWTEIQNRAAEFASRWEGETYEKGESQSFWSEFLLVFGVDRRRHGAFFEYAIKKGSGKQGFIDLFWPGKLLAEQKSGGKDTGKARLQAYEYLETMPDHDLPRMIVVSDFATFELIDITTTPYTSFSFPLADLSNHVRRFSFLIDERTEQYAEEDPVNRTAAENMAKLHNQLEAARYTGRDLELLLVRLVFCLFADDARIFERNLFANYLRNRTQADGSDLGPRLVKVFEVLNTPEEERQTTLDPELQALPYINGGLFAGQIRTPDFTPEMRQALLTAALVDWGKVSPAIFGSMFQGVMDPQERRNLGAHYTSERNILRVIKPLFLDDLYAEYAKARTRPRDLKRFHDKLATINLLDPACGSGNFLVIAYRELRRLEHKVVVDLTKGQMTLDVRALLRVNVDQMHGIEIEEFPALIAQTALWLTDHQMNLEASAMLGQHYVRLPLTAAANIVHSNALTTDWAEVVPPEKLTYILGNPPFIGKKEQTLGQKALVQQVFRGVPGAGNLDFVACWYRKALDVMERNPAIQTALVSTNSITQGEQVSILWTLLLKHGAVINFAHRTFKWTNEARRVAAVYCVIVGFALIERQEKTIFEYPDIRGEGFAVKAFNINPYLASAPNALVRNRREPLSSSAPNMNYGSMPIDNGHLTLEPNVAGALVDSFPQAGPLIRPYIGGYEFLNSVSRYCLWLVGTSPQLLKSIPPILERVEAVRLFRLTSGRAQTRALAGTPGLFGEIRQPDTAYLLIPKVSSENRDYLPIGIVVPHTIASGSALIIPNASIFMFGILQSSFHMSWMRYVGGRMKSDYQYSASLVYNNFPWLENVTDGQRAEVERLAQGVLDARAEFPGATLADLYDPLTMPPVLAKAHATLDRAVDRLYRKAAFESDAERVALLFERYQALTAAAGA
jgi:hypothetical protein